MQRKGERSHEKKKKQSIIGNSSIHLAYESRREGTRGLDTKLCTISESRTVKVASSASPFFVNSRLSHVDLGWRISSHSDIRVSIRIKLHPRFEGFEEEHGSPSR